MENMCTCVLTAQTHTHIWIFPLSFVEPFKKKIGRRVHHITARDVYDIESNKRVKFDPDAKKTHSSA